MGGWHEKERTTCVEEQENSDVGGKLAACIWIYHQAVTCNGRRKREAYKDQKRNSVIEAMNWSRSTVLPGHKWASDLSLIMHQQDILQTLKFDIDVPRVVQCGLLWFFRKLVTEGRMVEKYCLVVNVAQGTAFKFHTSETFSPRRFLLPA